MTTTISRARRLLGFCFRQTKEYEAQAFKVLYTALVLPILEYASLVWFTTHVIHCDKLEAVQSKATRISSFKLRLPKTLSRDERLCKVGWQSLTKRVEIKQLKFVQKICDKSFPDTVGSSLTEFISFNSRTNKIIPRYQTSIIMKNTLAMQSLNLIRRLPQEFHSRDAILKDDSW